MTQEKLNDVLQANLNDEAGKSRILVIDDNRAIHDDIRKILIGKKADPELEALEAEMFGDPQPESSSNPHEFDVQCALQGEEGLELLIEAIDAGEKFDMAFVDMRMPPGWDGVETIENLWKKDPKLPIVICTAYSDHSFSEISERLNHSNQFLILKKPFDTVEISQAAAALTARRKSLDALSARMDELEKKVAQQSRQLEVAHADAEQLLQSISSLLVSLDSEGRVCRWNPVAERLFDLPKSEAIGKPFVNLKIRWEKESNLREINRFTRRQTASKTQVAVFDANGELRRLGITVYPTDQSSQSRECLILGSDITEQTLLEDQLQQAQRLEAVGQLAAGVAHEINTPIQYIGDNVRYLDKCFKRVAPLLEALPNVPDIIRKYDPDFANQLDDQIKEAKIESIGQQIPEAIQDTCEGIESIASIVAAMKDFSHPGTDKKTDVDLNGVLSSAITVAKNEWKTIANVYTSFDLKLPEIHGLPIELNQAFLNIIVNACHAIADHTEAYPEVGKGSISISTHELQDFVEIRIADTGGGIPEAIRERVFEPFFTTKEVGKGTGQGLAITHSVFVQKHDGRIWFEVDPGVGTRFIIQLPKKCVTDQNAIATSELCTGVLA